MTKTTILFVVALFIFSGTTNAQNIKKQDVSYDDIRLPLSPIEGLTSYVFLVETPYPYNTNGVDDLAKQQFEDELANYPQTIADAEEKYQEDLANYDYDVEMARENFKLESDEFNKMSKLEKLAMSDQKPKLKLPRKPVYRKPSQPVYRKPNTTNQIVFDPAILAKSYLNIDGFERGETNNTLSGKVTLSTFEYTEPERKVDTKKKYNAKTKQQETVRVVTYTTGIKRPTYLYLEYEGEVLFDGLFNDSDVFENLVTSNSPNIKILEKNSVTNTISEINEYLNDNYGFSPMGNSISLNYVKNKKGEYDDLEEALAQATAGLTDYVFMEENENIKTAIEIWTSELNEYVPDDKKARIDGKVATSIVFNLLEIYVATNDMVNADAMMDKLGDFKLKFAQKERLKVITADITDRKFRLKSNGKL